MDELDGKPGALELPEDVLDDREIVGLQPLGKPRVRHPNPQADVVLGDEVGWSKPGLEGVRVDARFDPSQHTVPDVSVRGLLHEPLPCGAYSLTGFPHLWKLSIRPKPF
jgi:hypothetical protein